jgi:hypothetical protein
MLEEMEELFDVGQQDACCGCCPCPPLAADKGAGGTISNVLLGFRTLAHVGRGSGTHKSGKEAGAGKEPESDIIYDPSNLHKYSSDLRETKFSYFQDEDEPLVGRGFGRNHGTNGTMMSSAVGGGFGSTLAGGSGSGASIPGVPTSAASNGVGGAVSASGSLLSGTTLAEGIGQSSRKGVSLLPDSISGIP